MAGTSEGSEPHPHQMCRQVVQSARRQQQIARLVLGPQEPRDGIDRGS